MLSSSKISIRTDNLPLELRLKQQIKSFGRYQFQVRSLLVDTKSTDSFLVNTKSTYAHFWSKPIPHTFIFSRKMICSDEIHKTAKLYFSNSPKTAKLYFSNNPKNGEKKHFLNFSTPSNSIRINWTGQRIIVPTMSNLFDCLNLS